MRIELIYGDDGTINGYRSGYVHGCVQPVEENEYVLEDQEDLKKLTEYLNEHPRAKTIDKTKCKLKMCVNMKELNRKIQENKTPTHDELKAAQCLQRCTYQGLQTKVKENGEAEIILPQNIDRRLKVPDMRKIRNEDITKEKLKSLNK